MSESASMKLIKKKAAVPAEEAIDSALGGESTSESAATVEAVKPVEKAKATVVAPKTVEKEKDENLDLIVQTSKEVENLTGEAAISMAKSLLDATDFNYFKLGGVLSVIQANSYWEGKGYESFKQFMEEEFSMPYRKGMYLIQIYNGLVESGVEWDKVKGLGWTKLKELANILTTDNVDGWVAKANDMTVIQLQESIKASANAEPAEDGQPETTKVTTTTTKTFKLHEDQKEIVNACIEKAKVDFNTEFDAVALENICTSYMEAGTGKPKTVTKEVIKEVNKPLDSLMSELGWQETINMFEKVFPNIDISLNVPEGM